MIMWLIMNNQGSGKYDDYMQDELTTWSSNRVGGVPEHVWSLLDVPSQQVTHFYRHQKPKKGNITLKF